MHLFLGNEEFSGDRCRWIPRISQREHHPFLPGEPFELAPLDPPAGRTVASGPGDQLDPQRLITSDCVRPVSAEIRRRSAVSLAESQTVVFLFTSLPPSIGRPARYGAIQVAPYVWRHPL